MEMTVREIERYIIRATELATRLSREFASNKKEEIAINKDEDIDLMDILDNYRCILRELKVEI